MLQPLNNMKECVSDYQQWYDQVWCAWLCWRPVRLRELRRLIHWHVDLQRRELVRSQEREARMVVVRQRHTSACKQAVQHMCVNAWLETVADLTLWQIGVQIQ
jgi:hypothetical protein